MPAPGRCNDNMAPLFFSLEGNIGSGKSSLLDVVLETLNTAGDQTTKVLHEPVGRWSEPISSSAGGMLQAYYEDPKRNGFAFQMFVLLSRVEQHQEMTACWSGIRAVLSERCVASDFELFGRPMRASGMIDDVQWKAYTAWTEHVRQHVVGAQVSPRVVYLRVLPEVSLQRIARRGRAGEQAIDRAYIEMLHAAHEAWIARVRAEPGARILVLNGNLEGDDAVRCHADLVLRFIAADA